MLWQHPTFTTIFCFYTTNPSRISWSKNSNNILFLMILQLAWLSNVIPHSTDCGHSCGYIHHSLGAQMTKMTSHTWLLPHLPAWSRWELHGPPPQASYSDFSYDGLGLKTLLGWKLKLWSPLKGYRPEINKVLLLLHSIYQIKSLASSDSKGWERDFIFYWEYQNERIVRKGNINSYIKWKSTIIIDGDKCFNENITE